ncbi:MAG: shikimate kinase [Deltaproteobacteria bacterium]|nr:shikimate kinase [Candidatus Zymogenaceae bacterium]
MATGKSAVGRIVADSIGYAFMDLDSLIEEETGVSVSKIFEVEGETSFRDRETKKIEEVSCMRKTVISTGGGAMIRPENREMLRKSGIIVCLEATVEEILSRAGRRESRPLINVENPREIVAKLLEERKSFYDEADVHIDTSGKHKKEIAGEIISLWEERKRSWNG